MDRHSLKVNATALLSEDTTSYILIYNVNIPLDLLPLEEVRQRVVRFLLQEFAEVPASFQLSATYLLVHPVTGQVKPWTGSFFPAAFAGAGGNLRPFRPLTADRLMQELEVAHQNPWALTRFEGLDTEWEVDSIESVIVNVNARVPLGFAPLWRRGLNEPNTRRNFQRKNVEFVLP